MIIHTGVGMEAASKAVRVYSESFSPRSSSVPDLQGRSLRNCASATSFSMLGSRRDFPGLDALVPRCFAGKLVSRSQAAETLADKAALQERRAPSQSIWKPPPSPPRVTAPRCHWSAFAASAMPPASHCPSRWRIGSIWSDSVRVPGVCSGFLARNPGKLGGFVKFVRGLPRAREAMTHALLIFIEENLRTERK